MRVWRWLGRCLLWTLVAGLALQLVWVLRIAGMAVWDPTSTAFQRSEAWRLHQAGSPVAWRQQWVPYEAISPHLKRAVIASEDALFVQHKGVDWQAVESARQRNAQRLEQAQRRGGTARLVGGSTITQQLAKNLFLSSERHLLRKGQEMVLAHALEALLSKQRILEIYLNHVEWGEGIFGAEAAAQHYFQKPAQRLSAQEAARLAVMLPAPKRYQRNPYSSYLNQRTRSVAARMSAVPLP
jgi:monofunctional glycosyltransferase